jgi:peptidoglycan/xylan/chitin deacetylase (PgdA/CDA1 family)
LHRSDLADDPRVDEFASRSSETDGKQLVHTVRSDVRRATRRCINVTVHGIGPAARTLDPGDDRTWVSVDQFEQVLDAIASRDDVRLTFDDGNASDVDIALPRLVERGLRGEFFIIAGLLGEPGRVDAAGIRRLVDAGMSIGSHGWAHRDWRRIDEWQATEEIVDAQRVLSGLSGQPVKAVAVPFGSYDRHVLRRLRHANVARVYTSDGGLARPDAWLQPRTSLRPNFGEPLIAQTLNPRPPIATRASRFAARRIKRVRGRP